MEIISLGHTNVLVKVELTWVQDPRSSSKSSWRLPTNTLNISYKSKVAQKRIIIRINFLPKFLVLVGIYVVNINFHYEN
jgi:hypothetical protein